jgi:AcrR family transcriptional regulator
MVTLPHAAPPRSDRRRVRTRAALVRAGQALFATRSVDAVSVDDIVVAAEVAKGSFYNHFTDKDALAREVAVTVRAEAEAEVDLANATVVDPAERVARALAVFVRFALADPERSRAMMRLFAGATLPDAPMNRGVRRDLEAGLAAGRFRDLTVETGVVLTMGVVHIAITRVLDEAASEAAPAADPPVLARGLALGLLRGLGLPAPEAKALADRAADNIFTEIRP